MAQEGHTHFQASKMDKNVIKIIKKFKNLPDVQEKAWKWKYKSILRWKLYSRFFRFDPPFSLICMAVDLSFDSLSQVGHFYNAGVKLWLGQQY